MIKKEHLEKLGINQKWLEPFKNSFQKFGLCDSKYEKENQNELAMFLAQCGHESCNFTKLEENLNYSAKTLLKLFSRKVKTIEKAKEITASGPKAIANFIYGNRADLGNVSENDGWKYRGRGIIQLTGKNNYKNYGDLLKIDLVNKPDLAMQTQTACDIACAYWKDRKIKIFARAGDIIATTKKINGGLNGLEDRIKRFDNAIKIIRDIK